MPSKPSLPPGYGEMTPRELFGRLLKMPPQTQKEMIAERRSKREKKSRT